MFDHLKEKSAIKSYFMKLSLELCSRFGKKHHYTAEEVTHTAQAAKFNTEHLPYAHALLCERKDFERHYDGTPFQSKYETLRHEVSAHYFGGVRDFDAANIIEAVRSMEIDANFHESKTGFHARTNH